MYIVLSTNSYYYTTIATLLKAKKKERLRPGYFHLSGVNSYGLGIERVLVVLLQQLRNVIFIRPSTINYKQLTRVC